jgi:arylsulfate sulfotransferase
MKDRARNFCLCSTTILLAFVIISCSGLPTFRSQVLPTNNPLVAQYTVKTRRPANVSVEFGTDTTYGRQTWAQPTSTKSVAVTILVAGMRASTTYHMRARVQFLDGTQFLDTDHVFTTGSILPAQLPVIKVTQPGSTAPEGIELLSLVSGTPEELNAVAVDETGNVIWYYDFGPTGINAVPVPIKLLPNGHFLVVVQGEQDFQGYREIDLVGNTIRELSVPTLNQALATAGFSLVASTMHHDILPLTNGHIILLVSQIKPFTDLPGFPGQTPVTGDALVDLDPSGKPVWTWSTFDHLDVNRHPMSFPDWTHSNAVIYSRDDGDLILSSRHQHWVMKIDYRDGNGDGQILWRLGPGGDFTLTNGGPSDWNYGQHFPFLTTSKSSGTFPLALYDNGNFRPVNANGDPCGPTTAPCYSRPVIFQLDEVAKTATIIWQHKLPVFSMCCGDIQLLPNGNMEFDSALALTPLVSSIQEVTLTDNAQLIWEMDTGQIAYRGLRIPSLYPGVDW